MRGLGPLELPRMSLPTATPSAFRSLGLCELTGTMQAVLVTFPHRHVTLPLLCPHAPAHRVRGVHQVGQGGVHD